MQNSVKSEPIAAAKRELERLAKRVSTVQLAKQTGIHQSQVSRLLRGQFKRVSPNVQTLLAYARQPARYARKKLPDDAAQASVVRAALRTWDSTPEGAQALVRLLQSIDGLRRLERK